jgi:hypothetical protein
MTNRERAIRILNYESYDYVPVVHFGYWRETLEKWAREGHITEEEASGWGDGNPYDAQLGKKLGFDFNWYSCFSPNTQLRPGFEGKVLETLEDGHIKRLDHNGVIVLDKPGVTSIPSEIDHLLKNRADWEEHYKWRYEFTEERITQSRVNVNGEWKLFTEGGLDFLKDPNQRTEPLGLFCGSLIGHFRDVVGVVGLSYMAVDDEELFTEIIDTQAQLCYDVTKYVLEAGGRFEFGHFWEDICFKNGPLVTPQNFSTKVGPHYKRITHLLAEYGISVVSVDCDGMIDHLIPTWLENGVNTMFPIEVGTWHAHIAPWREQYGKTIRGVGGMDKRVFSKDRYAIDAEIDRLKRLVELGGYIPCPDHRIPSDAIWENVQYYCDALRKALS